MTERANKVLADLARIIEQAEAANEPWFVGQTVSGDLGLAHRSEVVAPAEVLYGLDEIIEHRITVMVRHVGPSRREIKPAL